MATTQEPASCPAGITSRELEGLLCGELRDRSRIEFLEQHLSECEPCQTLADALPASRLEQALRFHSPAANRLRMGDAYELGEELGRGAGGIVYRARQPGLRRNVALKVLRGDPASSPDYGRFRREAAALAQVSHRNIVAIYDSGEQDGVPFIAMELVDGPSLSRWLGGEPLPPRLAAALVRDLADAVAAVHDADILHRDLKPQNVLVSGGEHRPVDTAAAVPVVKLTDFGLSLLTDHTLHTQEGMPLGTPSYMAPESAAGDHARIGPATDIYGLGTILYEALTGRPPFTGPSTASILRQVLEGNIVPVRKLQPDVPADLATLCERCLAHDPHHRLPSAAFLCEELQRFLDNTPIRSRPAGGIEKLRKWTRRRPWQAVALALSCLMVLGSLAGVVYYNLSILAERDLARANYQEARQTVFQMLYVGDESSVFEIPQLNELSLHQCERALALFERLARQELDSNAQTDLARLHMRIGTLQASRGESEAARKHFEQATKLLRELIAADKLTDAAADELERGQIQLAAVLNSQQKFTEAIAVLDGIQWFVERAGTLTSSQGDRAATSATSLERRAWLWHTRANALFGLSQLSEAANAYDEAITLRTAALAAADAATTIDVTGVRRNLAGSQISLAVCRMNLGDNDQAAKLYAAASEVLSAIIESNPHDVEALLTLAVNNLNLSNIMASQGDGAAAAACCTEGIRFAQRVCDADPANHTARDYLSMLYGNRALFTMSDRRYAESLGDWEQAEQYAVDAGKRDFVQLMRIRNLLWLQQPEAAREQLERLNPEQLAPNSQFMLAGIWSWLATQQPNHSPEADAAVAQSVTLLEGLAATDWLSNNQSAEDQFRTSSDFAAARAAVAEETAARWFQD